jgi:galactan endo-1,6-beta-galactosidase
MISKSLSSMLAAVRRQGRACKSLCLVFAILGGLLLRVHAQSPALMLDPGKSQGTWDGWGTSLCWWAKAFGDRDDVADLIFTTKIVNFNGERLPGLGMTIARYNVGACSWNEVDGRKMAVSKTILPFRQMEGFWLDGKSEDPQSKSWNWNVDANQRAMLLKARDRGAKHFELFSNSPMWWMCKNDNPSGQANPLEDNLAPENYEKFAVYMATVAKHAKDHWGLAFTTIEPFNEPTARWWNANGKQEGCHFSAQAQAALLPLLRRELDERGLTDLPIAASDESLYDQAIATWKSFEEPTKALISQVNVHGYQNEKGRRGELFEITRGKKLWNSEYGEIEGTGLKMTLNLHLDFRDLRPTAWCYWQPFDAKGWGLVMSDMPKVTFLHTNPKYFALAQYTRHIRPGMTILTTNELETIAAYDAKERKLVIVAHNRSDQPKSKTYDLSKFTVLDGEVTRWLTEPIGGAHYQEKKDARIAGQRLETSLPAHSIQTFEVENVTTP